MSKQKYCQQCSKQLFHKDRKDLKGLTSKRNEEKGLYDFVECDECGIIQIDRNGKCLSDCLKDHNPQL